MKVLGRNKFVTTFIFLVKKTSKVCNSAWKAKMDKRIDPMVSKYFSFNEQLKISINLF